MLERWRILIARWSERGLLRRLFRGVQLAAKFFVRPKRVRSSGDKAVEEALF